VPKKRERSVSVAIGATALTLGAGLGVVGAYFNYRASRDETVGNNANRNMEDERDLEEWQAKEGTFRQAQDDLKIHNALMYTGYAVGGALIVTGMTLLVVGMKKKNRADTATYSVTGRGLSVRF
jgi:hypothetical protein